MKGMTSYKTRVKHNVDMKFIEMLFLAEAILHLKIHWKWSFSLAVVINIQAG